MLLLPACRTGPSTARPEPLFKPLPAARDQWCRSASLLDVGTQWSTLVAAVGGDEPKAGRTSPWSCKRAARSLACGLVDTWLAPSAATRSTLPPGLSTWMIAACGTSGNARPAATRSRRSLVSRRGSPETASQSDLADCV